MRKKKRKRKYVLDPNGMFGNCLYYNHMEDALLRAEEIMNEIDRERNTTFYGESKGSQPNIMIIAQVSVGTWAVKRLEEN